MRPHRTHTPAQAPYPTHITPPRVATVRHLQISSHAQDTQKYPFTHTHAQPTHTQGATPSHTCSQAHTTQRMTLRRAHFPAWSVLALIYIGPHNRLYPTFLPQARTPGAHLCSASPTRQPAPARGFPLVCSGHSGQELKCSEEEPGASAPRLQERTAPAAAAPPARSRGASELRSRCSKPSRASVARPLPKFARGPRRAGQPGEERSRPRRRRRGLGVLREGRAEQRVQVTPPREVQPGLRSPQLLAPPGQGEEQAGGQRSQPFLETRGSPESRGEKRHFPLAGSPEGAQQRAASRRTPRETPSPGRERARRTQGSGAGLRGAFEGVGQAQPAEQ